MYKRQDLYLSHVIGVSAGSCNGVDYVSKQPGRTRDCMIHKEKEYNYYYGFTKFIREKSLLDMDMVFDKYPNELFPFDFETYFASEMECEIVTTNCETGRAEYMKEEGDRDRLMKLCRASSSMPLVSPIVNVDGIPYLDGGLADSIPIKRALEKGNDKIVLILTRNPGYRKKPTTKAVANLYRRAYKDVYKRQAFYIVDPGHIHAWNQAKVVYCKTCDFFHNLHAPFLFRCYYSIFDVNLL